MCHMATSPTLASVPTALHLEPNMPHAFCALACAFLLACAGVGAAAAAGGAVRVHLCAVLAEGVAQPAAASCHA